MRLVERDAVPAPHGRGLHLQRQPRVFVDARRGALARNAQTGGERLRRSRGERRVQELRHRLHHPVHARFSALASLGEQRLQRLEARPDDLVRAQLQEPRRRRRHRRAVALREQRLERDEAPGETGEIRAQARQRRHAHRGRALFRCGVQLAKPAKRSGGFALIDAERVREKRRHQALVVHEHDVVAVALDGEQTGSGHAAPGVPRARGDHRGGHVPQVIPGGLFRGSRAEFRGPVRRASRGSIRSGLGIPRRGGFVRGRARSIVPARRGGSRPPEPPPARSGRESRGRSGRENRRHPPHPRRRVWKLPEPRFQRRRGGSQGVESTTGDAPRRFEKRDFRAVSVSARHA